MRTFKTLPTNRAFFENYASLVPTLYRLGFLAQVVSALTEISIIYAIVYGSVKDFTPNLAPYLAGAGALIGTAFIEVGLRKFTPYSVRAILYRRFVGLDLVMTVFILLSTVALLFTSGFLSFKNAKTIVEVTAPAPEQKTTAAAQLEYDNGRRELWATFRGDSSATAQRFAGESEAQRQRFAALAKVEWAKLAELEGKERRGGGPYPTQKARIQTKIAELEAQQNAELAALQGRAAVALAELQTARKNEMAGIAAALTTQREKVERFNEAAQLKTRATVDKYGGGLAWFTVICLFVFVLSVILYEVHHKGSGISETVQPTQYDFLPGIFGELQTALTERLNYVSRNRIRRFAAATPPPPLPLAPAPLYDVGQVEQPRFVVNFEGTTGTPQQINLNAPPPIWPGTQPNPEPGEMEGQILNYCRAAQHLQGVGLEKEAREMELKAVDVIRLYLGPAETPAAVEELKTQILAHLEGNGPNPFEHLHRRPIGFARPEQAAANGERLTVNVRGKTKTCQHCGQPFEKKHWNARYCSDTCRVEAWEKRTGGKVRKRTAI